MAEQQLQVNSSGQEPWVEPDRRNILGVGSPAVAVMGLLIVAANLQSQQITMDRLPEIDASASTDLNIPDYYPNSTQVTAEDYLSGVNNIAPGKTIPAMLRFQSPGLGAWQQYNSADGCNTDSFQWLKTGLNYLSTVNTCSAGHKTAIDYLPGVTIMPPTADHFPVIHGKSFAVYYDDGKMACAGINEWTTKVLTAANGEIDIQNNETTTWTKGSDPSGCRAGNITKWQDIYKLAAIPVAGSNETQLGLKEEIGGDMARFAITGNWDYDVKFNQWLNLRKLATAVKLASKV